MDFLLVLLFFSVKFVGETEVSGWQGGAACCCCSGVGTCGTVNVPTLKLSVFGTADEDTAAVELLGITESNMDSV